MDTIALPIHRDLAQRTSFAVSIVLELRMHGEAGFIDQSVIARGKLGFVKAGGLIAELFFISNQADLLQLQSNMHPVASAVAEVLTSHHEFGVEHSCGRLHCACRSSGPAGSWTLRAWRTDSQLQVKDTPFAQIRQRHAERLGEQAKAARQVPSLVERATDLKQVTLAGVNVKTIKREAEKLVADGLHNCFGSGSCGLRIVTTRAATGASNGETRIDDGDCSGAM
ncbi:hypothetical protein GCM10027276_35950 [Comamonas piscis]